MSVIESDQALLVFFSILMCCVTRQVHNYLKIPMAAQLLFCGFAFQVVGGYVGNAEFTSEQVHDVEADLMLLLLIPSVVLPAALSLEWFTFRQQIVQQLILSTTTIAASTGLVAFAIIQIPTYNSSVTWSQALLLGLILSTIEHTSLVSQLKNVRASPKFESLVKGEAIMNAGVTLTAFHVLLQNATNPAPDIPDLVTKFIRLALGGLALGVGLGLLTKIWRKQQIGAAVREANLILVMTYLTYYLANYTDLKVSGALAAVAFGLYICAQGEHVLHPSTMQILRKVWILIRDNIEAVVFVYGGLSASFHVMNTATLSTFDFLMIFPLFGLVHVVRVVVLLVHYPLLRGAGCRCTWKELAVLAIGNTKESIVVILGLAAHEYSALNDYIQSLSIVWSTGVTALSIIIDNFILEMMVRRLGLESATNTQEDILVSVTTSILEKVTNKIAIMKKDEALKNADWSQIAKKTGSSSLLLHMLKSTRNGKAVIKEFSDLGPDELFVKFAEHVQVTDAELERETRQRFCTTLKGLYLEHLHKGKCYQENVRVLLNSANKCLEHTDQVMFDWYLCENAVFPRRLIRRLYALSRMPLVGRWFASKMYQHAVNAYDVAWNFMNTHIEAENLLSHLDIDVDKSLFNRVMYESRAQIELCRHFVRTTIVDIYPEITEYVQTKRACYSLLHYEKELVDGAYTHGTLTKPEFKALSHYLKIELRTLQLRPNLHIPSIEECIRQCDLFSRMYEPDLRDLLELAREVVIHPKETIYQIGETVPGIYLIQKGRVEEFDNDYFNDDMGVGSVLGLHYLAKGTTIGITSARALTTVIAVVFPMSISKFFYRNQSYRIPFWNAVAAQMLKVHIYDFGPMWELESEQQAVVLSESRVAFYEGGEMASIKTGGLLFRGGFSGLVSGFGLIKPSLEERMAIHNTVFFHFSQELSEVIMNNLSNLQFILSSLTVKDASGKCHLRKCVEGEVESQAPRIKVTVSSRMNSASGMSPGLQSNGQSSPRRSIMKTVEHRNLRGSIDTLLDEAQEFLDHQDSRPSIESGGSPTLEPYLANPRSESTTLIVHETTYSISDLPVAPQNPSLEIVGRTQNLLPPLKPRLNNP